MFYGLVVDESGTLVRTGSVRTLSEAEQRANELKENLSVRGVHKDVLEFWRAELVEDNYIHAVLEATKSIATQLRTKSGLTGDGGSLVDRALGGNLPKLVINGLRARSEQDEQRGFANLVKEVIGMFRNPIAHEARLRWRINKVNAEDLSSLAYLVHSRLDMPRVLN